MIETSVDVIVEVNLGAAAEYTTWSFIEGELLFVFKTEYLPSQAAQIKITVQETLDYYKIVTKIMSLKIIGDEKYLPAEHDNTSIEIQDIDSNGLVTIVSNVTVGNFTFNNTQVLPGSKGSRVEDL